MQPDLVASYKLHSYVMCWLVRVLTNYTFPCHVACSRDLDVIAMSKLVQFVNALTEKYFDFVQQRIQQEVRAARGWTVRGVDSQLDEHWNTNCFIEV